MEEMGASTVDVRAGGVVCSGQGGGHGVRPVGELRGGAKWDCGFDG